MGIGIEYYAFALFVAGLICLIAILCKMLFADLRRQHKLLDEKETNLLQLYRRVETIMEEFVEQAKTTTEEIKAYESRIAKREAAVALPPEPVKQEQVQAQVIEKLPRSVTVDSSRIRAASEVLERAERIIKSETLKPPVKTAATTGSGAVFQSFFDETASENPPETDVSYTKSKRNEMILALAEGGKTNAQIASELGITVHEVMLVIDLIKRQ